VPGIVVLPADIGGRDGDMRAAPSPCC
jgi:hypothetical protein